jgi:hypothetical protein
MNREILNEKRVSPADERQFTVIHRLFSNLPNGTLLEG